MLTIPVAEHTLPFMRQLNAAIQFDGNWFVARCLDVPVTSQGETMEAAKLNLKEAIELCIETWGFDEVEQIVVEMVHRFRRWTQIWISSSLWKSATSVDKSLPAAFSTVWKLRFKRGERSI